MILYAKNRDTDIENKCVDIKGEERWEQVGLWNWHIHTVDTMYKIESSVVTWIGRKEVQKGGDICIPMADSFCWILETNTLQSNYNPIKINLKKYYPFSTELPLADVFLHSPFCSINAFFYFEINTTFVLITMV